MEKIYTKAQAEDWFLSHSSGEVIAVNAKGEEKVCGTYPEAVKFITN